MQLSLTDHHVKYYPGSSWHKTKAKCPKCGKTFTSERGYAYVGPAKLAPYFCLECKYQLGIIFNENNDATDCDIAEWGF